VGERIPAAPRGLGPSGRALWRSVLELYDIDVHDRIVLIEACRCADRCDQLAVEAGKHGLTSVNKRGDLIASPLLAEARQQEIVLTRLIASLRLPVGQDAAGQHRGPRGAYQPRRGLRLVDGEGAGYGA
jgi:hypothetical protein